MLQPDPTQGARRLLLSALDQRAAMNDDSAVALLRAAKQADPGLLRAHLDYIDLRMARGERQAVSREYQVPGRGTGPFHACLALVTQHRGLADRETAAVAQLESTSAASACSAVRLFQLHLARGETSGTAFDARWRRVLQYDPDVELWRLRSIGLREAGRSAEARGAVQEALRRTRHPLERIAVYVEWAAVEQQGGAVTRADELRRLIAHAIRRENMPGIEWAFVNAALSTPSFWPESGRSEFRDSLVRRRLSLARARGEWHHRYVALYGVVNHMLDERGETAAAVPLANQLVSLADSIGRPLLALAAYRTRGRLFARMGRIADAQRDLRHAVHVGRSAQEPWELGEAYHNLAHVFESAGRMADASAAADQWIATIQDLGACPCRIMAYRDAGMIRWKAGWHASAAAAFERMVATIDAQQREYYWAGEFYEREGDFPRALSYYRLAVRRDVHNNRALNLAGVARMFDAVGQSDSAEALAREHDRLGPPIPLAPFFLARQGQGALAIAAARDWARERGDSSNVPLTAASSLQIAELLLDHGTPSEALMEGDQALRLAQRHNLTRETLGALRVIGLARLRLGDTVQAIHTLAEAAYGAASHGGADVVRDVNVAFGGALAGAGKDREALDAFGRAADQVERVVSRLAEDVDRVRHRARQLSAFDGALRVLLRQPDSEARTEALSAWSQRRKAAALAVAVPWSGLGRGSVRPIPVFGIRQHLARDEALVDYTVLDSAVSAIVFTHRSAHVRQLSVHPDSLRRWIDELSWPFREHAGGQVDVGRLTFDTAAAMHLHDALIAPLNPLLNGSTRLMIVPDGVLHALAFEMLQPPEPRPVSQRAPMPPRFLIDRFEIAYRPSVRFAAGPLGGATRLAPDDQIMVLAYAAPGALSEAEAIRGAWNSRHTAVIVGERATETALTSGRLTFDVLHVAAHAVADHRDPLKSHLRLAPDSANDGYFHIAEVARQRLAVKLVVLSGCETLSGTLYNGEGLMGLARAFAVAGAEAIVATRWPIGEPAADLFRVFYSRLQAGVTPARALHDARVELRNSATTAHPFFWGGFMLLSMR